MKKGKMIGLAVWKYLSVMRMNKKLTLAKVEMNLVVNSLYVTQAFSAGLRKL